MPEAKPNFIRAAARKVGSFLDSQIVFYPETPPHFDPQLRTALAWANHQATFIKGEMQHEFKNDIGVNSYEIISVADELSWQIAVQNVNKLKGIPPLTRHEYTKQAGDYYQDLTTKHIAHFLDVNPKDYSADDIVRVGFYRHFAQETAALILRLREQDVTGYLHHTRILATIRQMEQLRTQRTEVLL